MKPEEKRVLRYEIHRAFHNPLFCLTVFVGILIGLPELLRQASIMLVSAEEEAAYLAREMRYFPANSVYYLWIGAAGSVSQTLYYQVFPLLAVTPYALSGLTDQKSGYARTMVLRAGKKSYYWAKYLAVFLSGGAAVSLPLLVNFMLTACYAPMTPTNPYSIWGLPKNYFGAYLYYKFPIFYVLFFLMITFLFGGALAALALAVSRIADFVLTVWLAPFLLTLVVHYAAAGMAKYEWVLKNLLICGIETYFEPVVAATEWGVLIFASAFLWFGGRDRKDIL